MPLSTYEQSVADRGAILGWALDATSGTTFAPYLNTPQNVITTTPNFVSTGTIDYSQADHTASASALNLHAGAKLTLTFTATVSPPFIIELWVKLPTTTPAANQVIFSTGTAGTNGIELYVTPTGLIRFDAGSRYDQSTGVFWPDTNWHRVDFESSGAIHHIFELDNVELYQADNSPQAFIPSPNILVLGGQSGAGASSALQIAWPALYLIDVLNSPKSSWAAVIG